MTSHKRKIADRDDDELETGEDYPSHQNRSIFSNPFIAFSALSTQWGSDLRNTSFNIARLSLTTLSSSQLYQRQRDQRRIVDVLANIRRNFFSHVATAQNLSLHQPPHSPDLASDIEEIVKALRYVIVRWESFLKRNTPEGLQNGKWVIEVGMLATQMWTKLGLVGRMLKEIEGAREEDRKSEWRRFEEVEELWREDYEKLLDQETRIGTRSMWADWNNYFDQRFLYLNNKREVVQQREGEKYREHRDWIMMTAKIDAAYAVWIQWRVERGPEEVELKDGRVMGIL